MDQQSRQPRGVPVGGQFATGVKIENPDLAMPVLTEPEREAVKALYGRFPAYATTPEMVSKLASSIRSCQVGCLWEWRDDDGFKGKPTMITRPDARSDWHRMDSDALAYLEAEYGADYRRVPARLYDPFAEEIEVPWADGDSPTNFAVEDMSTDSELFEREDDHECMAPSCETLIPREVDLCDYCQSIADNHENHTEPVFECVNCPDPGWV